MVARKNMKIPSDYVRFSERCRMNNLCKPLKYKEKHRS